MSAFAQAENEGVLGEFSTLGSLTDAQKRAAKENCVDDVAQGNRYDCKSGTASGRGEGGHEIGKKRSRLE